MKYWLMKSEPEAYSIDDLKKDKQTHWDGIRNYQARNYMRDDMKIDDQVLFYHSNAKPPGVAGIARVCKLAYPDFTALDKKSKYYAPKATSENPIWMMVDVEFVEKFSQFISLSDLRNQPGLEDMLVLKRGMRLSIQPLSKEHFDLVCKLGRLKS